MKKTSNEEYYSLFCKWQESGQSMSSFATASNIPKQTFYYWCKKFTSKNNRPEARPSFSMVPMKVPDHTPTIKINFPSGVSMEFFGAFDLEMVRQLVG